MMFRIPIYVQEDKRPGGDRCYRVQVLWFHGFHRTAGKLSRALNRLATDVRRHLRDMADQPDHRALARWTFAPKLSSFHLKTRFELRRTSMKVEALVVWFEALGRNVALVPAVPEISFELKRRQDVRQRASDALGDHYRRLEQKGHSPESFRKDWDGREWLTELELEINIPRHPVKETKQQRFSLLGGDEKLSGAAELEAVGRCLNHHYPDELDRAVLREREVEELQRLLTGKERRPILLTGPRKVGKSAIIQEVVWRLTHDRGKRHAAKRNTWLIAPARLISGMSFVGQWENRVQAILEEVAKQDHVLYFDDLPGLLQAGQTSKSDFSVADMMKTKMEARECRVIAEATPEELRILRENDRRFADQFHVMPVYEPNDRENLEIQVSVQRQLEEQHECTFELGVLPRVIDLQRRHASDSSFPGKAAGFLRYLAAKFGGRSIGEGQVLEAFQSQTGLSLMLLSPDQRLNRRMVDQSLRERIIGQDEAVAALTDVVMVAKARLNDPSRPLASFLFLGPTGVGKTQSAKALAHFLFGDEARLTRFDMNEYNSPDAVARLIGTRHEPEGLLTAAIRRQPFSVVLLDEIEKADADVFDVLLALLGEGRLTDALGRTASFNNAIVILTSNLGVKEAGVSLGFRPGEESRASTFIGAAEKFFRPEFFNRLDRVVPFEALRQDDVERIANLLIREVFERDGLRQRQCVLRILPAAMDRLVHEGYHPQFGARALKRVIEKQLAQPVAVRLSTVAPGVPTIINVLPADDGVESRLQPIEPAARHFPAAELAESGGRETILDASLRALERIEQAVESRQPGSSVELGNITGEQEQYFALREQCRRVRAIWRRLESEGERPANASMPSVRRPRHRNSAKLVNTSQKVIYNEKQEAAHFADVMTELEFSQEPFGDRPSERLVDLLQELSLLETLATADAVGERVALAAFFFGPVPPGFRELYLDSALADVFENIWGLKVARAEWPKGLRSGQDCNVFYLEVCGPGAERILGTEVGTWMFCGEGGRLMPVQIVAQKLAGEESARDCLAAMLTRHASHDAGDDNPLSVRPLSRVFEVNRRTVDMRTGLAAPAGATWTELRSFALSQLKLPAELTEVSNA